MKICQHDFHDFLSLYDNFYSGRRQKSAGEPTCVPKAFLLLYHTYKAFLMKIFQENMD